MSTPAIPIDVVVVVYGNGPYVDECVAALLDSTDVQVEVYLVDNGDTSGAVDRLAGRDGVTVLRPGSNTGFAEGCNIGAGAGRAEVLALVNPDVVVDPSALVSLARAACEPQVGIATSSLRLADAPDVLNSAGNPVHYLGLAWAGAYDEPADDHAVRVPVASASGACCALRRDVWDELDGFASEYFAYHEDVELSLRCWQRGLEVVYIPDAVARHYYEFGRNELKTQLLERNRWLTVLTVYSARTLTLLAPALLGLELLMLAAATVQGWLPAKLRGYRWLLVHRAFVRRRRAQVQATRTVGDRELATLFAARFEPANLPTVPGMGVLNSVLAGYWTLVRRVL